MYSYSRVIKNGKTNVFVLEIKLLNVLNNNNIHSGNVFRIFLYYCFITVYTYILCFQYFKMKIRIIL